MLIVGHRAGTTPATRTPRLLSSFAGQAALALERARAQEEREQLVVLEDRERIARDLHDVVIQRLFATGMQLQGAVPHAPRPEVAKRINAAVDDLDATIRDIRRSIFELRTPVGRVAAHRAARRRSRRPPGRSASGPSLDTSGPVDSAVPDDIVPGDAGGAARGAVQRRPARPGASAVRVSVRAADGEVVVRVEDDGVGTDPARARGGLVNMGERAHDLGGTLRGRAGLGRRHRW